MESACHVWNRELKTVTQVILNTLHFEKNSLKMVGVRSLNFLESPAAKIYRFLIRIGTDLSVSRSFSKDNVLSLHTMRRHLSCN